MTDIEHNAAMQTYWDQVDAAREEFRRKSAAIEKPNFAAQVRVWNEYQAALKAAEETKPR